MPGARDLQVGRPDCC